MAWVVIRAATEQDWQRLNERGRAFIARHNLAEHVSGAQDDPAWALDCYFELVGGSYTSLSDYTRLAHLWRAVKRRALNEPSADGIAWDYVGYHVK